MDWREKKNGRCRSRARGRKAEREARQRAQKAKLQRMAGSHAVGTYSDSVTQASRANGANRGRALRYSPGTRPFRYWLERGWTQSSPASVM
jgi:hypothetical protein